MRFANPYDSPRVIRTLLDVVCEKIVEGVSGEKVVHDAFGRDGTNRIWLYGMDIDPRCVNMCRIQLRLNGLDGFGRMAAFAGQAGTSGAEPGGAAASRIPA